MKRFYNIVIILLAGLYLANCFGPLRLEYDSLKYFRLKDCLEAGCPPGFNPTNDTLPYGYAFTLVALSKIGLLKSFFIAFVNGLFLFTGIWFVKKIFHLAIDNKLLFIITLLNWTLIKLFSYPLSEMQFLFFSCGCLYFFTRYAEKKNMLLLIIAFAFAIMATLTRTIGVTLMPALFLALIPIYKRSATNARIWMTGLFILASITIVLLFTSKLMGFGHYTEVFTDNHPNRRTIDYIVQLHFTELGQLLINFPIGKLESLASSTFIALAFIVAGILLFAVIVWTLFKKRKQLPLLITTYLTLYTLLVFYWSYNDPRFWVPVIPLFVAVLLHSNLNKWLGRIVFIAYACAGVTALGYSLYTSFNKRAFAKTQANGIFRSEYETHFFGKPSEAASPNTDPYILEVLKKTD